MSETLIYQRAQLIQQARALIDGATARNRDLTADETATVDRILRDATNLQSTIRSIRRAPVAIGVEDRRTNRGETYTAAFWQTMAGVATPEETRGLIRAPDPSGGYLAPDETEIRIIEALTEDVAMRQYATVVPIRGDRNSATVVNDATAATYVPEGGEIPEDSPTFARRKLRARKLAKLIKASVELDADVGNLQSIVEGLMARSFGLAESSWFLAGDGVTGPRGITIDADVALTAAATGTVTGDELLTVRQSLAVPYRDASRWFINDTLWLAILKLKAVGGEYIVRSDADGVLFGRPVTVTAYMPAATAGLRPAVLCDPAFYLVGDQAGLYLQKLVELYAVQGQVAFVASKFGDGRLSVTASAKCLQMAP
jgi:HK97 family phage major capsid protein